MAPEREAETKKVLEVAGRDGNGADTRSHLLGLLRCVGEQEAREVIAGALAAADDKRVFWRLALSLARLSQARKLSPDLPDLAVFARDLLCDYARRHARFPALAVRAISYCSHDTKVSALVELMEKGRIRQRRAAPKALARTGAVNVVVPLSRAAKPGSPIRSEALAALRSMGRPNLLAIKALEAPDLHDRERLEMLKALSILTVYVFPLSYSSFDPERWLTQEVKRGGPLSPKAAAVLARMKDEKQLLRGAQPSTSDSLLRAAGSAVTPKADETLLRATGVPQDARTTSGLPSSPLAKVVCRIRSVVLRRG